MLDTVRNMFDVAIGERYEFVPLVLLGLSLIAMAARTQSRERFVWVLLVLLMLTNGASITAARATVVQRAQLGGRSADMARQLGLSHGRLAPRMDRRLV